AQPPDSGRGEAAAVIGIPGIWVDIDIAGPAHKAANLPPTRDAALSLLNAFPYPPSLVVDTGHGLQAYWLFPEPWVFAGAPERTAVAILLRRVQRWFQIEARSHGWQIDSTHDLARVLRVPGTFNRKTANPAAVQILHLDESRRYAPDDFDGLPEVEP